ncbi:MAG: DNA gyrase subunit A [Thermacetogeniaceae bacterium]|jgi:DNA gyrase subunit A|nr:DNA gyrase subunit A [Thermoanaerobacterales bacterium]NLN21887.1 DNA gyrase subunit A [Syntrophomonadaceae bacterium]HAF17471.1 DNA gyrase subunit A [Peptococcaceae bacterium]
MPTGGSVIPIDINEEVKRSYLDYAMSVIVGRALPDVRDGLKPVQRRILYAMYDAGITPDKPYKKSAVVVGNVLARYHPHGDAAVYDALVRLAQDFVCRYPLVDGHGNFGSIDGDAPAAMRYTEVRLAPISLQMLADIEQETVDFMPNYDESTKEPAVLPSRIPNLLVNGSAGIAVGMATNIPPHNLSEVIDGLVHLIDHPEATIDDLMKHIPGPDFPSAGYILGRDGIRDAYTKGRGSVVMRGKAEIEKGPGNKTQIVITELPYQVNKARLIERIAELVREKKIEGISDLRDESDRTGMRIVVEVKKDANPQVILNRLYKHTNLQDTFGVIMIALVDGEPRTLNLKQVLDYYLQHQITVIRRRSQYQLRRAQERLHIVEGLVTALDHIDEVINLIRSSQTDQEARSGLMEQFGLSEIQAQAILDMRLKRLTGLEREKVLDEKQELEKRISYLEALLASDQKIRGVVRKELLDVKKKFGDERRTVITAKKSEFKVEDIIPNEYVVVTLTRRGYIKRIPVNTYRGQHRGGKGITALTTKDGDLVEQLFVASTHSYLLFFTNKGKVYRIKVYEIPEGSRQAKGTALVNLIPLEGDEFVTALIPLKEFRDDRYLFMVTRQGTVKKGVLSDYDAVRKDGLIAIRLRPDDELIGVRLTEGNCDIMLVTKNGKSLCFNERDVRSMGRTAYGVLGIRLDSGDEVVGMERLGQADQVLVVTEKGYGKRTELKEYRLQKRGGKGIITLRVTERNGHLVSTKVVDERDEVLLMSSDDIIIRIPVKEVTLQGRNTQGVRLMRLNEDERVVAVAKVPPASINDVEKVD